MGFKERSAWITAAALGLVGGWHGWTLWRTGDAPLLPVLAAYTICLTGLMIFGHAGAALLSPGDARARADERDLLIAARAGSFGGAVLGASVIGALGWYLVRHDAYQLFNLVLASLALGQFSAAARQVVLYRRG